MALPVNASPLDELSKMFEPEELCAELASYIEDGRWGKMIRHPLVYCMMYHPIENRRLNEMLRLKRKHIAKLKQQREYSPVVWFYERPWRLQAFTDIAEYLSDTRYWSLLGDLWTDSENIWQSYTLWHDALHCGRPRQWAIMRKADRDKWRKLRRTKHPLLIYRGYATDGATDEAHMGMSWTLNRVRADWFARRFAGQEGREHAMTALGIVDPEKVIAYFGARNEEEVVVLPEDVHLIRLEEL